MAYTLNMWHFKNKIFVFSVSLVLNFIWCGFCYKVYPGNLLENPGFESGIDGWSCQRGGYSVCEASSAKAFSGSYSGKILANSGGGTAVSHISQQFIVPVGADIMTARWFEYKSIIEGYIGGCSAGYSVRILDTSNNVIHVLHGVDNAPADTDWQGQSQEFSVQEGQTLKISFGVGVYCSWGWSSGLNVYIDEIALEAQSQCLDIGLRAYNGTSIIPICCEPAGTLTSPLRIAKDGAIYGIVLVDSTDTNATSFLVNTSTGVRALREYTN